MREKAWGIWMTASLISLFVHFPQLSVKASAEFSLTLSAIGAIILGIWQSDRPLRHVNLRWLAVSLAVFISYSLITSLPNWVSGNWTESWAAIAWLGRSVCMALLLSVGTIVILQHGHIDANLLIKLFAMAIFISIVIANFPSPVVSAFLPYASAHQPLGFFYSTRIAAFWCVIGMALSAGSLILTPLFIIGLFACNSAVAWVATIILAIIQSKHRLMIAIISMLALFAYFIGRHGIDLTSLRIKNWLGVASTILSNPLGIGTNPLAYSSHLGNRGLLPHPASDVLFVILEYGWVAIIGIVLAASRLFHSERTPLWTALVCILTFSLFQTALHHSHNLMISWMVLCAWLIERSEYAKRSPC